MIFLHPFNTDAASETSRVGTRNPTEVIKDRTITGKVTLKEDGSGMPGVNVVIKGTQKGSTTNASGRYIIEISGDNSEQGLRILF